MKYEKGTFTVVPNISTLSWKNPILQTIYMWICKYSNDDWVCFPSVSTLAKNCWTSSNSIRKYLKELEELWILQRERRFKNNQETSSIYQLIIWGTSPDEVGTSPDEGGGTSPDGNRTISNYLTISNELSLSKDKGASSFENQKNNLIWKLSSKNEVVEDIDTPPVPPSPPQYWDPDINKILDIIKKHNDWLCAGTQQEQRQYWKLLIKKLEQFTKDGFDKFKALDIMINKVKGNQYHNTKIVWPKKIYYSFEELVQIVKWSVKKTNRVIKF